MSATTVRFKPKPFTWSYSRLKNFELCPVRHNEIDLLKNFADKSQNDPNSALVQGNLAHAALRDRLSLKTPLPPHMMEFEPFVRHVEDKIARGGAQLFVEQKYAITREFAPTTYFASNVWFRGIADALVLWARTALVVDWKTGRIQEDSVQLALMAQCIFSHYPQVQVVVARFAWLKEFAETDDTFTREDLLRLWPSLLDRVASMEKAAKEQNYQPTHNGLCREHCPVETCRFHGVPFRRG